MAVDFQDSFTEASTTVLGSHTPDTGTGWTQTRNSTSANLQVDGAGDYLTASGVAFGQGEAFETDDVAASADNDVEITITTQTAVNRHGVNLYGNATSAAADYYMFDADNNGTNFDFRLLERNASGTPAQLASSALSITNGDVINLKLRSNSQACQLNGVDKTTGTDTTITAAGHGGFGMGRPVGMSDNTFSSRLSANWQLDGFKMTSVDAANASFPPWKTPITHLLTR